MREYRYFSPASLDELFAVMAAQTDAEVKILAGGTDIVPKINMARDQIPYEAQKPMALVSIGKLGLSGICEKDGKIVIGTATTITEIQDSELIRTKAPALAQAADSLASFAIRNAATLGGNMMNASPAADTVPAVIALNGEVTLCSAEGTRTMAVADFMVGPGKTAIAANEIVTEITITPSASSAFQKLGRRAAETLSVVNAAACIECADGVCTAARIVIGSAAPTAKLCTAAADALIGKPLTEENIKAAAAKVTEVLSPIDDIRASAWYRLETAPVLAARAVKAAAGIK